MGMDEVNQSSLTASMCPHAPRYFSTPSAGASSNLICVVEPAIGVGGLSIKDVQPRAAEVKAAVLSRRMPPWGAVKGFGEFRNDQGLTQEQIGLITDWIET